MNNYNNYIKLQASNHIIQLDDIICVSEPELDSSGDAYVVKITWVNQKTIQFKYYTRVAAEKDFNFISEKLLESDNKTEKNMILS